MKTFQQFITEAQGRDDYALTPQRKPGEGGRVRASRKKTEPEKRRTKVVGGGKTAPAKDYKPRKDIGTNKPRSQREQQPTKERGSAALSAKEAQRKASGLTQKERHALYKKGERALRDLRLKNLGKKKESELKHRVTSK